MQIKDKKIFSNSDNFSNKLNSIFSIWDMIIAFFLFILCMFIFNKMYSIQEDQTFHLNYIFENVEVHKLFISITYNSIMRWLVYVLGLGNKTLMFQAFPFLLSFAFVAKYFVIRWINIDYIDITILECLDCCLSLFVFLFLFLLIYK
jgi:hypothetical protein